jgi:hypothetical protein
VIALLIKLLPYIAPALRYADDPARSYWRVDLLVYTVFVWVVDMVLAALFFSPQRGEWTISHTLERTALVSTPHKMLALEINRISPNHIKSIS